MRGSALAGRLMAPVVAPLVALVLAFASAPLDAAGTLLASPIGPGTEPASPWRWVGLPGQRKPHTRFSITEIDGQRALRVEAESAYGNLVHVFEAEHAGRMLSWQWRLDLAPDEADPRRKDSDDAPVKVCAMFDHPTSAVPFVERQVLRLARLRSGENLPAATVCYVWDRHLAPGTVLDNAYTRRVRMIVLRGPETPLRTWQTERRDVVADFLRLYADEATTAEPLAAVSVGADTDNTHTHSLAYVRALSLEPAPAR